MEMSVDAMGTLRAVARFALFSLFMSVAGCAFGGGNRTGDAGPTGGFDAGPMVRFDAGNQFQGTDAGPPGTGTDAGPPITGTDAGPPITGTDAGPPMTGTDAGPPPPMCSESPCRLVAPQCGCAVGQGCTVDATDHVACGPRGPEAAGQTCSGPTACQAGLYCLANAGSQGVCSPFCDSDAMCGPNAICGIRLADSGGAPIPGATLCSIACDPITASGCPTGQGCAILQETSGARRGFTMCRPQGSGYDYDPCTTEEDCETGHFCGSGSCVPLCRNDLDCYAFEYCVPFSTPLMVGTTEWGYCY
ncbi:MAG: hypothetical protein AB7S26_11345 [Sandaracinaceae bacterium]